MRIIALLVLTACTKRTPETVASVADAASLGGTTVAPPETLTHPYAGYMERLRRQVNYWWQQNLDNLPSSVRLAQSSYTTEVAVILNGNGALKLIEISESSGSSELDDAVVRAFRLASPFDTPPDGLVQKDGSVYLPDFDFTVQLATATSEEQQFPGYLMPPADLEPE